LVVAHRVHENDLSANLLASGRYAHVALPIIATRDQTYETNYGRWRRRKGELLRPDADDIEELEQLRGELVNPSFEMLYQQDADAQALPAIRPAHFKTFEPADVVNLPHFISIDTGISANDGRSFTVAHV
jgi:hypothetical protein